MLETPHAMVGAAIAIKIGNPFLAIPIAFLSHFALEKVPHWNPHLNTETKKYGAPTRKTTYIVIADSILALSSGSAIAWSMLPNTELAITILLCCFAAVLPDLIEAPYFFLRKRTEAIKKWISFQKSLQVDTSPIPGLATQLVTILAALWWMRS